MTRTEWRGRLNELVKDTFGIGKEEWRWVNSAVAEDCGAWCLNPMFPKEKAAEHFKYLGQIDVIEHRLMPLDFCTSLDAVRQVEEAALQSQDDLDWWIISFRGVLGCPLGSRNGADRALALATAEQRVLALLAWRGVEVPPQPKEPEA